MALTSSAIVTSNTLEEFRLEFNKLRVDVTALDTADTYVTNIVFEGSTTDSYQTTLAVTDPTADRTITLPNLTGTLSLLDATETLTNKTLTTPTISQINSTTITLNASADIVLDADGADVKLKDGGTNFGRFTNSGGELVIKSGSSATTAATFSGANVTFAGTLAATSIDGGSFS